MNPSPPRWDIVALREGASVCLLLAVPPTLIARLVVDDQNSSSGWAALLVMVTMFGFVLGAGVAAWRQQSGTPLSHGVVVAVGVFVAVQAIFLIFRLISGGDVRVGRILVSFSLAATAGVIGGLLGSFLRRNAAVPNSPRNRSPR